MIFTGIPCAVSTKLRHIVKVCACKSFVCNWVSVKVKVTRSLYGKNTVSKFTDHFCILIYFTYYPAVIGS